MPHALLVLAAGMGSRYGGLKQMDPVGPKGETLLDYAVFDALAAGFSRVVFVIRKSFEEDFRRRVGSRYAGRVPVDCVCQSVDDLPAGFRAPAGREKPWGTGHAVWCARGAAAGNFAVVNADDYYGADAFVRLARFLEGVRAGPGAHCAMVGFRLDRTLSEHGAVSRGVCAVSAGRLSAIVEQTGITPGDVGPGRRFSGDEVVSMNCWGFTPGIFAPLERQLTAFLSGSAGDVRAEFYLPTAIAAAVAEGSVEVAVLPAEGSWMGITHKDDKPRVVAAIARLAERGVYPPSLF
jgi:NDP-sugar pyrophosphorylase family protein